MGIIDERHAYNTINEVSETAQASLDLHGLFGTVYDFAFTRYYGSNYSFEIQASLLQAQDVLTKLIAPLQSVDDPETRALAEEAVTYLLTPPNLQLLFEAETQRNPTLHFEPFIVSQPGQDTLHEIIIATACNEAWVPLFAPRTNSNPNDNIRVLPSAKGSFDHSPLKDFQATITPDGILSFISTSNKPKSDLFGVVATYPPHSTNPLEPHPKTLIIFDSGVPLATSQRIIETISGRYVRPVTEGLVNKIHAALLLPQ